ncbi:CRISPR-associated protein Cas4, partial [Thermococci archaeon]
MKITGVMVQYYIACKRELWFFANHINMNYDNVYIELGRLVHERSFLQEKKNISIDNTISFDFIKKKGNIVIFEIKK